MLTDTATLVSATLYTTPTATFSTTVALPYCASCGYHETTVRLPPSAPLGTYRVDMTAARAGYESDHETSYFHVSPALDLDVTASQTTIHVRDAITLTAWVRDRGAPVVGAGVRAEWDGPDGLVALPLLPAQDGLYTASFSPEQVARLGAPIEAGAWTIRVRADYRGGEATAEQVVTVWSSLYLPSVLRQAP